MIVYSRSDSCGDTIAINNTSVACKAMRTRDTQSTTIFKIWMGPEGVHVIHSKLRGPRNVNGNVSRGTLTASRERRKNLLVLRTLPHSAKHRALVPNGRPG